MGKVKTKKWMVAIAAIIFLRNSLGLRGNFSVEEQKWLDVGKSLESTVENLTKITKPATTDKSKTYSRRKRSKSLSASIEPKNEQLDRRGRKRTNSLTMQISQIKENPSKANPLPGDFHSHEKTDPAIEVNRTQDKNVSQNLQKIVGNLSDIATNAQDKDAEFLSKAKRKKKIAIEITEAIEKEPNDNTTKQSSPLETQTMPTYTEQFEPSRKPAVDKSTEKMKTGRSLHIEVIRGEKLPKSESKSENTAEKIETFVEENSGEPEFDFVSLEGSNSDQIENLDQELFQAIQNCEEKTVNDILDKHPDYIAREINNTRTALEVAAMYSNTAIVSLISERLVRADETHGITKQDKIAIITKALECVEICAETRAEVNKKIETTEITQILNQALCNLGMGIDEIKEEGPDFNTENTEESRVPLRKSFLQSLKSFFSRKN